MVSSMQPFHYERVLTYDQVMSCWNWKTGKTLSLSDLILTSKAEITKMVSTSWKSMDGGEIKVAEQNMTFVLPLTMWDTYKTYALMRE